MIVNQSSLRTIALLSNREELDVDINQCFNFQKLSVVASKKLKLFVKVITILKPLGLPICNFSATVIQMD